MSPKLDSSQFTALAIDPQQDWNLGEHVDHWSPSSLAMLRRCPRQFQERYLKGRKERPAESPLIGTAVHAGLERNFRQKVESHVDIPTVELIGWYDDAGFEETLESEQEKTGYEVRWDTDPESAQVRGRRMLGEYQNVVAPRIQPLSVEGSVSVDFGLAVPVIGRYDLLREQSTIDWKTGKAKATTPKESWRIQAAVYEEATGRPIEFHSISATAKGTVSIVTPLESERLLVAPSVSERAEMRRTLAAVSAEACLYMELLGPDEPWPTHGRFHTWACDYCGFRNDCPAWSEES